MFVENAKSIHASEISSLLSHHFESINNIFGYKRLKSDQERLEKIITERIEKESDSEFKYFILVDNHEMRGFVNLMVTKEVSEILVLILKPEYNTTENVRKLLDFSTDYFTKLGISKYLTEINLPDKVYLSEIDKRGAHIISAFYEINI